MSQIQNMNSLQSINNDDFYKHILSKIIKPRKKKHPKMQSDKHDQSCHEELLDR